MPRIEICNPSTQVATKPYDAIESHQTAAEALANLSNGSQRPTRLTNDPILAKRFPNTLWEVLSNEENSSVIAWIPNGKGFSIFNRGKLISDVLPKYFKTKKYTSFTRRLNRWGFECFTKGHSSTYVFHHPLFIQDKPELASRMSCCARTNESRKSSSTSSKSQGNDDLKKKKSSGKCPQQRQNDFGNDNFSISQQKDSRKQMLSMAFDPNQLSLAKRFQALHSRQLPLINGYITSNLLFPEASSFRTQSIISNALRVLDQSDLKCLEVLQTIKRKEYNRFSSQMTEGPLKLSGIGAHAA